MPVNRQWTVLQQPQGAPELGKDIALKEAAVPSIKDGQFLVRMTWLSLDPYMRGTMNAISYGRKQAYPRTMTGGAVGQVVESKNPAFPVGVLVNGQFGWQDYAVSDGEGVRAVPRSWSPTWALGVLGMPGATAYLGLTEICKPKKGEVLVVSSCTGAVGAVVGQVGKILGCKTVGFTSKGKTALARDFGYDHVIEYTGKSVRELIRELRKAAPKGVNCYFDNSGGDCTEATLMSLALFARVAVCGQIAYYNLKDPLSAKAYPGTMVALQSQSLIRGFIVSFLPYKAPGQWGPAFEQMAGWIRDGKLKVVEDTTEGLDHAFDAFTTLFHGIGASKSNVGKKLVKIAEPPLPLADPPGAAKL